jgi:hypothetical protein
MCGAFPRWKRQPFYVYSFLARSWVKTMSSIVLLTNLGALEAALAPRAPAFARRAPRPTSRRIARARVVRAPVDPTSAFPASASAPPAPSLPLRRLAPRAARRPAVAVMRASALPASASVR